MKHTPSTADTDRETLEPAQLPVADGGQRSRIDQPASCDPNGGLTTNEDPVSFVKRIEDSFAQDLDLAEALSLVAERDQTLEQLKLQVAALNDELVVMATMLHRREATINELKLQLSEAEPVSTPSVAEGKGDLSAATSVDSAPSLSPLGMQPDDTAHTDVDCAEPCPPAAPDQDPRDASPVEGGTCPTLQRMAVALQRPVASAQNSVPPSRRRDPRRACEIELEFTEDTHFYAGITQDMSEGGVFIATYNLFPVGTRLELAFELPEGSLVSARGQVRWLRDAVAGVSRPGMGVAFTELSAEALTAIARFCNRRAPLYVEV